MALNFTLLIALPCLDKFFLRVTLCGIAQVRPTLNSPQEGLENFTNDRGRQFLSARQILISAVLVSPFSQRIQRRECSASRTSQHMRVDHRRRDIRVAQQFLHRPDIRAALQ